MWWSGQYRNSGLVLIHDKQYPSPIIVGEQAGAASNFATLLLRSASRGTSGIAALVAESTEAEAIEDIASTYFALRGTYFNEFDSCCEGNSHGSEQAIKIVSLDPGLEMTKIIHHLAREVIVYQGYQATVGAHNSIPNSF